MRRIKPLQIACFMLMLVLATGCAGLLAALLYGLLPPGDFRGVVVTLAGVVLLLVSAMAIYRLFLLLCPLTEGEAPEGSRAEFAAQVHFLFYLLLFGSLTRTHLLPVPMTRLMYLALGARLGRNTYSAGAILDPPLTRLGDDCVIGHNAVLFSHVIEGPRLALAGIEVGNGVTIGAMSVVMPGVRIGDGAIVSVGAVVSKGTHIGPGEIWGGIPARLIKRRDEHGGPHADPAD